MYCQMIEEYVCKDKNLIVACPHNYLHVKLDLFKHALISGITALNEAIV